MMPASPGLARPGRTRPGLARPGRTRPGLARPGLRTYDGAVVIVTGGASGIGRALAEALARQGARVVLADLQAELAEEVADGVRSRGGEADVHEIDVADFTAVERVVGETFAACGRLDYLFNNAGIGVGGGVELYGLEDWDRVFDVNLRGVAHGVQAAYPLMIGQGFGHLVNTASLAGLFPAAGTVGYCATKHAVVGLSTSLRIEAAEFGVRVSVLCPGVIRTPILDNGGRYGKMLQEIPPDFQERMFRTLRPMDADRFAEKALHAVAANRAIVVLPARWRLFWWLQRLSPSMGIYLSGKMYRWTKSELERSLVDSG